MSCTAFEICFEIQVAALQRGARGAPAAQAALEDQRLRVRPAHARVRRQVVLRHARHPAQGLRPRLVSAPTYPLLTPDAPLIHPRYTLDTPVTHPSNTTDTPLVRPYSPLIHPDYPRPVEPDAQSTLRLTPFGTPRAQGAHVRQGQVRWHAAAGGQGRVVQVDPIKPTLKAPGNEHSKLKHDELLSFLLSNSSCGGTPRPRGCRRRRRSRSLSWRQVCTRSTPTSCPSSHTTPPCPSPASFTW